MTNNLLINVAMSLAFARTAEDQKWLLATGNSNLLYQLEIIDDTNMIELSVARPEKENERFIIAELSLYKTSDEALVKIISNIIDICENDWIIPEES